MQKFATCIINVFTALFSKVYKHCGYIDMKIVKAISVLLIADIEMLTILKFSSNEMTYRQTIPALDVLT